MKKLTIILFMIMSTLLCCLMYGCSQNDTNSDTKTTISENTTNATTITEETDNDTDTGESICAIDILSYDSNKILASYSTDVDDSEKIMFLLDTVNYLENTTDEPDELPVYVIHFIDESNSKYDMWDNVYIYNKKLYIQVDTAKTENNNLKLNAEIQINTQITPEEFEKILEKED